MIRILGIIVGAFLAASALVLFLGIPEFHRDDAGDANQARMVAAIENAQSRWEEREPPAPVEPALTQVPPDAALPSAVDTAAPMPLLDHPLFEEELAPVALPALTHEEDVFEDFISTRLSLKDHPVRLVRAQAGRGLTPNAALRDVPQNGVVTVIGAVITRQRPATASGVIFITLEDETGSANLIVWPKTFERYRAEVMQGRLLRVTGKVQREGQVIHLIAQRIEDRSHLFDELGEAREQIDMTWSSQDEVKKQVPDARQSSRPRKPTAAQKPAPAPAMHPRTQARRLFASRDFH